MSSDYDALDWLDEDHHHVSSSPNKAGPVPIKGTASKVGTKPKPKPYETSTEDLRSRLKPIPKGYRLADERSLTRYRKSCRTWSLRAALEKRESRHPVNLPSYQRPERRTSLAKIVGQHRRRKAASEALTVFGPYDLIPSWETRAWETELQKAVDWFMDTFGGPEHPEERKWREDREGWKPLQDAHFGNDPADSWDWTFTVPERDGMDPADFYRAREWSSPYLPPRFTAGLAP